MNTQEMTPAQATLFQQVYVPAFIQKCAELGTPIGDEASLHEALETAAMVKVALSQQTQSLMKTANLQLKSALGVDVAEAQQAEQIGLKQAAYQASANPAVRQALLAGVL